MHTCFTLHTVVNLSTNKIEEANLQNELARIKVDSLNTEAHNVQLKDTLEQLETELTARDNLIAKYQLEIRQRTDEIEKKMYRVDR
jgi:coiled-coil domain-containing protein 40